MVEEPAKRYGVEVNDVLVDALMEDAPKEDARHCWPLPCSACGDIRCLGALTKDNYDKVGGLTGLIEDAGERALRGIEPEQDVPLPSAAPPKRFIDLGASTLVPALLRSPSRVQRGPPRRQVAELQ